MTCSSRFGLGWLEGKREEEERCRDEEDSDGGRSLHGERSLHDSQILLVHSLSFSLGC